MPLASHLKYHAQAMRLLGHKITISEDSLDTIQCWEKEQDYRLPESVREWYSLEGADERLAPEDGSCGPVALTHFLESIVERRKRTQPVKPFPVPFFIPWKANTGYQSEIVLSDLEDPSVKIPADARYPHFSNYVLEMAWWRVTFAEVPSLSIVGKGMWDYHAECGPPHLDFLIENFEELLRQPQPYYSWAHEPPKKYKPARGFLFFRPGDYLCVTVLGDPTTAVFPARYDLTSTTLDGLLDLYDFLWPCHGSPVALSPSKRDSRKEMKLAFRKRFPEIEIL